MARPHKRWTYAVLCLELPRRYVDSAWAVREHTNGRGETKVAVQTIASFRRISKGRMHEHLHVLEQHGLIRRTPGGGVKGRGGCTDLIELVIPSAELIESVRKTRGKPNASSRESVPKTPGKRNASRCESVPKTRAKRNALGCG